MPSPTRSTATPRPDVIPSPPPTPASLFLCLPLELRLEVYTYLLVHPHRNGIHVTPLRNEKNDQDRLLHPAILLVSRQINAEGSPILYGQNTFLAHPTMLKDFPCLRFGFPPVREASVLPRIRRFHFRLRLDCDVSVGQEEITKAFTGMEELVVEVWQAMFLGADHQALKVFEGVRGVRRTRVVGSTTGFDHYARWLEGIMQSEVGSRAIAPGGF